MRSRVSAMTIVAVLLPGWTLPASSQRLLSPKQTHKFNLGSFLSADYPDQNEVAVDQMLVSGV
jgi:hypothetical protein